MCMCTDGTIGHYRNLHTCKSCAKRRLVTTYLYTVAAPEKLDKLGLQ